MAKVEWTEKSEKDLEKLDRTIVKRILKKIDWLSENFNTVVPETLRGDFKGTFKLRVGDWRVIYTLDKQTIVIQFIGHRSNIYKLK